MTDEKKFEVHAEITARLTQQDVDDIMVSALEGGISRERYENYLQLYEELKAKKRYT